MQSLSQHTSLYMIVCLLTQTNKNNTENNVFQQYRMSSLMNYALLWKQIYPLFTEL